MPGSSYKVTFIVVYGRTYHPSVALLGEAFPTET